MTGDATRIRPPGREAGAGEAEGGEACLVFVEGESLLGHRVSLASEVVLGRDPECSVRLPAEDVSRRHARIAPDEGGHLVLDLGSTNGTWVNGREVERHRLGAGDRVRVGPFLARYFPAGDPEARHLEDLGRLARRDPLTGLANRRAFEEELARETARAVRTGAPLALVLLDVDRFKRVNDDHGHPAGDAVLVAVATRAAATLRAGDLLARVGGEELAALLPGADLTRAAEAAERIRSRVAAEPVAAGGASLTVTVSLGCATLLAGEADGAALFSRADRRLYEAKGAGRNCVRA